MKATRVLLMIRERTGSTLLTSMFLSKNGQWNGKNQPKDFGEIPHPAVIQTIPEGELHYHHTDASFGWANILSDTPEVNTVYRYMPSSIIPISFLDNMPGDNWKFVYLFRNPKNKLASIVKRGTPDSAAPNLTEEDRLALRKRMFEHETIAMHHECKSVLELQADPRVYVCRFENLIQDPAGEFEKICNFIGVQIDKPFYQSLSEKQAAEYTNTSFRDNGKNSNKRWDYFTEEELKFLDLQIGDFLQKLGYER
jgi:hypothetical protein